MKLYFDIGNTNIKIHFSVNGKDKYFNYETKAEFSADSFWNLLPEELKTIKPTSTFICSVVPSKESMIVELVEKYFRLNPVILQYPLKTGVKIKASEPKNVGADLIALSAFVASKAKEAVMVNMGTATTIIYVKDSTLEGAIISAGLGLSLNALISNAAKLNDIKLEATKEMTIGRNTNEAISIGVLKGHVKMIEGLVADISKDIPVFVSGGHSKKVIHLLPREFTHVNEATIEGMKIIEKLNENI